MNDPTDVYLSVQLDNDIKSLDPSVVISAFLYLHPEKSVASIAKPDFGITPAALARALRNPGKTLREDWKEPISKMLLEDDFADYQRKVNLIARANDYMRLRKNRSILIPIAVNYLKAQGLNPEPFASPSLDCRSFGLRDRKGRAAWIFAIPDNLADSNGYCKSFLDYVDEYLRFAANNVTLGIFANKYTLDVRGISLDGLPKPVACPEYQQTVILQMSDDYSQLLGAYQWRMDGPELTQEEKEELQKTLPPWSEEELEEARRSLNPEPDQDVINAFNALKP